MSPSLLKIVCELYVSGNCDSVLQINNCVLFLLWVFGYSSWIFSVLWTSESVSTKIFLLFGAPGSNIPRIFFCLYKLEIKEFTFSSSKLFIWFFLLAWKLLGYIWGFLWNRV